jgi:xanthine/CO dehydrogenase XdhC/CoxF family maturation factor
MTGMVRFNGSANGMEVYDGNGWQRVGGGTAHIDLSYEAQEILDWAATKMADEKAYKELAEKSNAVKIALENVEQAKRQLDITAKLSREHETTS